MHVEALALLAAVQGQLDAGDIAPEADEQPGRKTNAVATRLDRREGVLAIREPGARGGLARLDALERDVAGGWSPVGGVDRAAHRRPRRYPEPNDGRARVGDMLLVRAQAVTGLGPHLVARVAGLPRGRAVLVGAEQRHATA